MKAVNELETSRMERLWDLVWLWNARGAEAVLTLEGVFFGRGGGTGHEGRKGSVPFPRVELGR